MCLGQRTVLLRPDPKLVNPDFLVYYLLASEQQYGLFGTANGSTVAHINLPTIRNLKISLPALTTQNTIAGTLSSYDDLIENNQKQIKLLEEATQRLYKEWFIDLCFPGHETTPITDGVPEGWLKGKIFDTEEKITDDAIKNSSAKIIPQGSILMAMYGATIGKIGIAATELICNQACCVFNLSEVKCATSYLYCWLKDNREYFISQGKGAAQPNLSQAMIKNFSILIPPPKVLTFFSYDRYNAGNGSKATVAKQRIS